jgi:hypothetical protein
MGRRQDSPWTRLRPGSGALLRQRALLGLAGECIGANTGAQLELLLPELLRLELRLPRRRLSSLRPAPWSPCQRLPRSLRLDL